MYAKVLKSTGQLLAKKDLGDNPVLDYDKTAVWVPVIVDGKPSYDPVTQTLSVSTGLAPSPWEMASVWKTSYAVVPFDLLTLKANRRKAVDANFNAKMEAGRLRGGKVFGLDRDTRETLESIRIALLTGEVNPHGGYFRAMDNTNVSLDDTQMAALCLDIFKYVMALSRNRHVLKDAIKAAVDIPAVLAIDIESGWPDNT